MRLSEFLSAELAVVPLAGSTAAEVADELSERLIGAGLVVSPERLGERIAERRGADVVTLGPRVALLHYRTQEVRKLGVVLGVSRDPLPWAGEPGADGGRLVIMIVIPPREAGLYVQLLAALARVLSRGDVVSRLIAADTADDLVATPEFAEHDVPDQLTVRELMTADPKVTRPDAALVDAARQLVRSGIGALPVVDEHRRVVGMLSEREILRQLVRTISNRDMRAPSAERGETTVREVMTRQVLCVSPEQPVSEVASLMINKDVDRVPVASHGELVGFLTRGDIIRKLMGS